jgi:hypothetical protein
VTTDFTFFWDVTLFETRYRRKDCGEKVMTNTCTNELNTKKFGNQWLAGRDAEKGLGPR